MIYAAEQKAEAGGSPFELNLCRLEWTLEHLMVRNSREVLPVVTETLHYFSTEGHQIEIGLATLYQAMASFQTGDAAACATQLAKVLPMIDSADTQQPFITAGRAVKPILEMMKTPSQLVRMSTHLLQRIRDFETRLPLLRKQLRPHTTAIPFAPPRLIIRALGRMQVRINGCLIRTADWQSTAARDLFFLILSIPEGLSKEETGAILWPDSSPSELKLRFKNTVYRLRRAIGRETISFDDEIYRFNRSLDYEYDVETFLNELRRSEQAVTPEGRIRHYQAAVNTYKGDYLPGVGETWVINVRERLHRLFMDTILKLVNLHIQGKNYNRALEYCQRALEIDPCCEDAHRCSMQAYAALGNRPAIQRQYDLCRRTLLKEMDVTPTAQTEKMYIDFLK
jgi:LuxR family maltose regulon positive regulatory protein